MVPDEHTTRLPAKRVGDSKVERVKAGAVGKPIDLRTTLFEKAGITEDEQAQAARKVFNKLTEQLEAETTKFFSFEGQVIETRNVVDHATQGRAAEQLTGLLGLEAPKANRSVVVVHKVELPEWAKPDKAQVEGPAVNVVDAEAYDIEEETSARLAQDVEQDGVEGREQDACQSDAPDETPARETQEV